MNEIASSKLCVQFMYYLVFLLRRVSNRRYKIKEKDTIDKGLMKKFLKNGIITC